MPARIDRSDGDLTIPIASGWTIHCKIQHIQRLEDDLCKGDHLLNVCPVLKLLLGRDLLCSQYLFNHAHYFLTFLFQLFFGWQ